MVLRKALGNLLFLSATWRPHCRLSVTVEEAASPNYFTRLFSLQVSLEDHEAPCSQLGSLIPDTHEVGGFELVPYLLCGVLTVMEGEKTRNNLRQRAR